MKPIFSETAEERVGNGAGTRRPRIRPARPAAKRIVRSVDRGRQRPVHDFRSHRRSFCRNFSTGLLLYIYIKSYSIRLAFTFRCVFFFFFVTTEN